MNDWGKICLFIILGYLKLGICLMKVGGCWYIIDVIFIKILVVKFYII